MKAATCCAVALLAVGLMLSAASAYQDEIPTFRSVYGQPPLVAAGVWPAGTCAAVSVPPDIAVTESEVLLSGGPNAGPQIVRFDRAGNATGVIPLYSWQVGQLDPLESPGQIGSVEPTFPPAVAAAPSGAICVVDYDWAAWTKYAPDGTYLRGWGGRQGLQPPFLHPTQVCTAPDNSFYVLDPGLARIKHFSAEGAPLGDWGTPPVAGADYSWPADIAAAGDDGLWLLNATGEWDWDTDPVALRLDWRAYRYGADGVERSSWPVSEGAEIPAFGRIDTDSAGDVWVLGGGTLRQFSPNGHVLAQFETTARNFAVSPDDLLWLLVPETVADEYSDYVDNESGHYVLETRDFAGNLLHSLGDPQDLVARGVLNRVWAFAGTPEGDSYAAADNYPADSPVSYISHFGPDGTLLEVLPPSGVPVYNPITSAIEFVWGFPAEGVGPDGCYYGVIGSEVISGEARRVEGRRTPEHAASALARGASSSRREKRDRAGGDSMTRKGLYLRGVIVVLSVGWSAPHGHAATQVSPPASVRQVTLEVGADPRQKLLRFGCSLVDLPRARIPDRESGEMFDRVFRDLKMRVLRLWVGSGDPTTVGKMMDDFCRRYVDSGVIADARRRGVTTLLLAPDRGTEKATEPMADYARRLAGFIATLKRERGIRIDVTGVANEPDGLTPEEVAEVVRLLRAELDARSLQSVAIIAPESASADAAALRAIAGIKRDPAAWRALRGIATHSYDMAATPDFPATIAGTDKQYWMTEASDNGNEGTNDAKRAATIAARFLNDLNNGVTHWIYFIGFDASDDVAEDSDNATKLMVYDHKRSRIFTTLKYDWFRQLRAAFPDGSLIYPLTARPGGALVYTYGQKPMLDAAAARLPDGSWSLGIVNLSGVEATPEETRLYETRFRPASELHLTIGVEPLAAAGPLSFRVFRSSATRRFVPAGTVVMRQGELKLALPPRELVTLRSVLTVP